MIKSKHNILFISHYSAMYGANKSLCTLILELRETCNIRPFVLIPDKGVVCKFCEENNIRYFISHYYWWVNNNKGVFQILLNVRKQILNISRIKVIFEKIYNENINLGVYKFYYYKHWSFFK